MSAFVSSEDLVKSAESNLFIFIFSSMPVVFTVGRSGEHDAMNIKIVSILNMLDDLI